MLIVGLGNPGKKYARTRHNVGFMAIDELAKEKPAGVAVWEQWALAKPKTFMNQSGKAVKQLLKDLSKKLVNSTMVELTRNNLLIVHDDIDIPLGEFKIQKGRGAAGHKGVQSVINELKTKDFWRIRIGICSKRGKPKNVEKFVLQKFTKEEEEIIEKAIGRAIQEIKKPFTFS